MNIHPFLYTMTLAQLDRLYDKLYKRMTYGMGYQPYGYDMRTLWMTNPELAHAMTMVLHAIEKRKRKVFS